MVKIRKHGAEGKNGILTIITDEIFLNFLFEYWLRKAR